MKKETMESILSGGKTKFRVSGYTYRIELNPETRSVCLVPVGDGDVASSCRGRDKHEFTHGGRVFLMAVEIAKEIEKAMPQDTDT